MAVTFATCTIALTTSLSSVSKSLTVSGTNPVLVYGIAIDSSTVSVTAVSWSLGGTSSRIVDKRNGSSLVSIWSVRSLTTGSGTISARFSGTASRTSAVTLFTSADPTNPCPVANVAVSSSTSTSTTLTPSGLTANDCSFGIGALVVNGAWTTVSPNQRDVDNSADPGFCAGDSSGTTGITIKTDGNVTAGASMAAVRVQATSVAVTALGWGPLLRQARNQHLGYINFFESFEALQWLI